MTLSVQKGEGRAVMLHEGPLDEGPTLVRRIAEELGTHEQARVQARLARRPLPGNPGELHGWCWSCSPTGAWTACPSRI